MRKIPFFRQRSSNICGLTCIQMLCAYYGKLYNIDTIIQHCELTKAGVSIRDIVNMEESLECYASSFSVNPAEARRIPLQAILYLKEGHFVILEKIKYKRGNYFYKIIDPDYDRVELSEKAFIEKWIDNNRGFGVLLVPKDDFLTINPEINLRNRNKEIFTDIKSVTSIHKKKFIWVILLTFIVLGTNWAMPILLQKTIDDGIMAKDINFVWLMLLAQFVFFIGFMLSNTITNLPSAKINFIFAIGIGLFINSLGKTNIINQSETNKAFLLKISSKALFFIKKRTV